MICAMRNTLRAAAAVLAVAACHGDVRDPRVGTIELVLEPVQRASAPDAVLELDHVRSLVERRLAVLRVPVEVATEHVRLVVALRADARPDIVSRVKAAVLTQGRVELRGFAGNALGPILLDNGAIRDARSTFAGDTPAIAVSLRRDAAERFEAATRGLVGSRILITLDDRLIAAPLVDAPISGGRIQFMLGKSAWLTRDVADTIALVLKTGEPLPVPLRLLEERRIPPRAR
jgi:preprotein translocase subunit SecD